MINSTESILKLYSIRHKNEYIYFLKIFFMMSNLIHAAAGVIETS